MEVDHLHVLGASHVSLQAILVGADHVTHLAIESALALVLVGKQSLLSQLLLVALAVQVSLLGLHAVKQSTVSPRTVLTFYPPYQCTSTADLADFTIVGLWVLRWCVQPLLVVVVVGRARALLLVDVLLHHMLLHWSQASCSRLSLIACCCCLDK